MMIVSMVVVSPTNLSKMVNSFTSMILNSFILISVHFSTFSGSTQYILRALLFMKLSTFSNLNECCDQPMLNNINIYPTWTPPVEGCAKLTLNNVTCVCQCWVLFSNQYAFLELKVGKVILFFTTQKIMVIRNFLYQNHPT